MKNNLLVEITDFKNDVRTNGMFITTYLNKRKDFLQKIELASANNIKFFKILYFSKLISKEQYLDYKMKVANARKYYKGVLSSY